MRKAAFLQLNRSARAAAITCTAPLSRLIRITCSPERSSISASLTAASSKGPGTRNPSTVKGAPASSREKATPY
jgi:hypothetical protein